MKLATAAQMRQLDETAIGQRGVDSLWLMENAAWALAGLIMPAASGPEPSVAVFCGPGNNGGDGTACAWLLARRGWRVRVFLVGRRESMTRDHLAMEQRLIQIGAAIEPFDPEEEGMRQFVARADAVVDALFGVGLSRPVEGAFAQAVACINQLRGGRGVFSADIASGVSADTGAILGCAVQAEQTATFSFAKIGQFTGPGADCCGKVTVFPIGIPEDLMQGLLCPVQTTERPVLPPRDRRAHKGEAGRVVLWCGSVGYTGAPVLAADAAVGSGAGLVFAGVPAPIYPMTAARLLEAMPFPLPADAEGRTAREAWPKLEERLRQADAALIGPGLGRSAAVSELVRRALEVPVPLVVDADALFAVAQDLSPLKKRQAVTVLTPHAGEFQRLVGGRAVTEEERLPAARQLAADTGCIVVLKGYHTVTALPDGRAFLNLTGNAGMAKGGSGDVLAGVVTALLGQGWPPEQAVPWAVWLHGAAGDWCRRRYGTYAMRPGQLTQGLAHWMQQCEQPDAGKEEE